MYFIQHSYNNHINNMIQLSYNFCFRMLFSGVNSLKWFEYIGALCSNEIFFFFEICETVFFFIFSRITWIYHMLFEPNVVQVNTWNIHKDIKYNNYYYLAQLSATVRLSLFDYAIRNSKIAYKLKKRQKRWIFNTNT